VLGMPVRGPRGASNAVALQGGAWMGERLEEGWQYDEKSPRGASAPSMEYRRALPAVCPVGSRTSVVRG
jgi:hypothetical protein